MTDARCVKYAACHCTDIVIGLVVLETNDLEC